MTSKGSEVLINYCSICNRKKSITVSDNTIEGEGLVNVFKNFGEKRIIVSKKKMSKNILKNPSTAFDITGRIQRQDFSNPQKIMSTLSELITFYYTGKGFYLGKFV